MKKLNLKGFGAIEALLITVIVVIIGGASYLVYNSQKKTNQSLDNANNSLTNAAQASQKAAEEKDQADESQMNVLQLANNSVSLTIPKGWTYVSGTDKCRSYAGTDLECIEGSIVTPGEKLPTAYGDGTEFFYIYVSVHNNTKNLGARKWLEDGLESGIGTGDIKESSVSINGYDTFSRVQQYGDGGNAIRELDYSFVVGSKAITVHARTYDPGELSNGDSVGDFRKFEPSIADMVSTIQVK